MNFHIRPYQPADLERLKEITVDSFTQVSMDRNIELQFGTILGHDWKWRKARHIEEDVRRDPQGTFIAEADAKIVGYITTWIDREAGVGNIPNLAVESAYRGAGLGRALILRALDHFREQGCAVARIETLEQNPVGQKLYPACGFREIARQIHYCVDLRDPAKDQKG
jgi:ribosomal protein S18 acetylase RimI-like enzyme